MTGHRLLAVVALVALTTLAACGSQGGTPSGQPTGATSSPFDSGSPSPPSSPSDRGSPVTVRGTVDDGVEAGCLVLTADSSAAGSEGTLVLVGNTSGLRAGDTVTLRGSRRDDLMTICQQGQPFWVDEVVER